MKRGGVGEFERMGDLFVGDMGPFIFAFLKLPQMPNTFATSRAMRELTKQKTRELLAVARSLNAHPLCFNLRDADFLGQKKLNLSSTMLRDVGIKCFSAALASGALCQLEKLILHNNIISDSGMVSLADAMARGALGNLTYLELGCNKIGDSGVTAFAGAIGTGGALSLLQRLGLGYNQIGDLGMIAFATAVKPTSQNLMGALASLKDLNLYKNATGDAGLTSLASACASGALASLKDLHLYKHAPVLKAACEARGIEFH